MRRANGKTYCIASNSDIVPEIEDRLADFALLSSDKFGELPDNGLAFEPLGNLACKFALLAPKDKRWEASEEVTVATSYPKALAAFAVQTGIRTVCTRIMNGKVERAPVSGLTDAAFDIVETGNSLRANDLQIIQEGSRLELGGVWRLDK